MKAAQCHRQAGLEEWARQIDGAGKLVGLHADQADQRLDATALDVGDDTVGANARVGFVERGDLDVHVVAEHVAIAAVERQPVQDRERVRGNGRAPR